MKYNFLIFLIILISNSLKSQTKDFATYIDTSDIKKFWEAFDETKKLNDSLKQADIFQEFYINKASKGLYDFIKSRNFTSDRWINSFKTYPKFWGSIRPKTENISEDFQEIEKVYQKFAKLYKDFRPPKIYYTIGILKGGTVINGNLIVGTELAASDSTVDFSELPKNYQDRMKINSGIIFLTTHELVHTQQNLNNSENANLLGLCLKEGSADFLTEIILEKKVEAPYIEYGTGNQETLWKLFEKEMYGYEYQNWLSNTATIKNKPADLGYFMGYIITKYYYENSRNKKQAIKEILSLDFGNEKETRRFLKKSKYK